MKNIEVVTIQQQFILDAILSNEVYYADTEVYISQKKPNLLKPYRYLVKEYGYKHFPIFACPIGYCCDVSGAGVDKGAMLIQLSVPEDEIRVQKYYDWSDLIFYMENPNEWEKNYPLPAFFHNVLFAESLQSIGTSACQITMEKIKREWLVDSKPLSQSFIDAHEWSWGNNILQNINQYD